MKSILKIIISSVVVLILLPGCVGTPDKYSKVQRRISVQFPSVSTSELFSVFQDFLGRKTWNFRTYLCDYELQQPVTVLVRDEDFESVLENIASHMGYQLQIDESDHRIKVSSKNYPSCKQDGTKANGTPFAAPLILLSEKYARELRLDSSFEVDSLQIDDDGVIKRVSFYKGMSLCSVFAQITRIDSSPQIVAPASFCFKRWLKDDITLRNTSWTHMLDTVFSGQVRYKVNPLPQGALGLEMVFADFPVLDNFTNTILNSVPEDAELQLPDKMSMNNCEALALLKNNVIKHNLSVIVQSCDKNRTVLLGKNAIKLRDYLNFMLFQVHADVRLNPSDGSVVVH